MLADIMVNPLGIERKHVAAFNALWAFDNLFGASLGDRVFGGLKEELDRKIRAVISGRAGDRIQPITTLPTLDLETFERDFYTRARPVVFKGGAAGWPCVRMWSPEYFAEHFGDRLVDIGDDKYTDRGGVVDRMPLREAITLMRGNSSRYVRFSSFFTENPALLAALDPEFERRVRKFMLSKGATQLFMGGRGTSTELHAAMTNNMFIQLWGQKDWLLFHPANNPLVRPIREGSPTFRSELRRGDLDELFGISVRLEAGDILYLPPFYWHYVSNPTFSIGMAYRWLALVPSLRTSPMMTLLTAMATNPSPFLFFFDVKRGNSAPHFFRLRR